MTRPSIPRGNVNPPRQGSETLRGKRGYTCAGECRRNARLPFPKARDRYEVYCSNKEVAAGTDYELRVRPSRMGGGTGNE